MPLGIYVLGFPSKLKSITIDTKKKVIAMGHSFTKTALGVLLLGLTASNAIAGQKVHLGRSIPAAQQVSMGQIDHGSWSELLLKYVNNLGQVDYRAWQASAADTERLDAYLVHLSFASRSKPAAPHSRIAFWINAYNAVTIRGILREYPTSSIRNHTARLIGYNIWHDLLLNVGGTPTSLNSIEHKILRNLEEPRIHFAIVCASHSCPRLLNEAYSAQRLEHQLSNNARTFFANRENFRHNVNGRQFELSSILDWFGDDFGSDMAARLKGIAPYLPTEAAQVAAQDNTVRVTFLDYDWTLNEQPLIRRKRD